MRLLRRGLVLWLALAVGLLMVGPAYGSEQLSWSSPARIDPSDLAAIDCPSMSLCVAGDQDGNILSTTEPTGGASAWKSVAVPREFSVDGLSCPSTSFCAVMGNGGQGLFVSHDPTGPAAAWNFVPIALGASATQLYAVSCASQTQCDLIGLGVTCLNEGGHIPFCIPAPPTTIYNIDPANPDSLRQVAVLPTIQLGSISCPTTRFCVAVGDGTADNSFNDVVATSSDPGVAGSWKTTTVPQAPAIPESDSLTSVSCGSTALVSRTTSRAMSFPAAIPLAADQRGTSPVSAPTR